MVRSTNPTPAEVERLVVNGGTTPGVAPLKLTPSAEPTYHEAGDLYVNATDLVLRVSNGTALLPAAGRRVVKTGAATLTAAESGALCLFNNATGFTYTLPTPSAGLWFDFLFTVTVTSGTAKVITAAGTHFLVGSFLQIPDTAAQIVARAADGTTIRAFNANGTTTGGYAGDRLRVTAISATQWAVEGLGLATGTEATPFATS